MRPSRAYAYFKAQEDMAACRTTWFAARGAQPPVDKQLLHHTQLKYSVLKNSYTEVHPILHRKAIKKAYIQIPTVSQL